MRIGRIIIDTDNMTIEELTTLINDLREVRKRKLEKANYEHNLNALLANAKEDGFIFIDKDFGFVCQPNDFEIKDERA